MESIESEIFNLLQTQEFEQDVIQNLFDRITQSSNEQHKKMLSKVYVKWAKQSVSGLNRHSKDIISRFDSAYDKIEQAILLRPQFHKHYYHWGCLIQIFADLHKGEVRKKYLFKALEKFKYATELDQNYAGSYFNWGYCLLSIAMLEKDNTVKVDFLEKTIEILNISLSLNINHAHTIHNLGNVYCQLAECSPKNVNYYYDKAIVYYSMSLELAHYDDDAHDNWGIVLKEKALLCKNGQEKEGLFRQAINKHLEAIEHGADSYNLACTYAVMGDTFNALLYLEKAVEQDGECLDSAKEDKDWNSYRGLDQFKSIINSNDVDLLD